MSRRCFSRFEGIGKTATHTNVCVAVFRGLAAEGAGVPVVLGACESAGADLHECSDDEEDHCGEEEEHEQSLEDAVASYSPPQCGDSDDYVVDE